ncbi:hypothetical protein AB6A40_006013 [Gnathostoma spinigerum]|uniref:PCI domain-containing protein n=1 Tax=Gnathostoma spinigerum TaxID=75299 RepID=A0ABD6EH52_9BILA
MLKHVELCVLLRKPHMAKDALFHYKSLTQQIAVKSLEVVIQHFLELACQKTEEAQKNSIEAVEEIDDLDQADAPENLLLSAVSGAAAQDRMDRTVLSPWLRFLWDSYRNCIDLLRNNQVVEQLYHRIARQSFEFCLKYQRRTEFRKLCDQLRIHLIQIQKHQHFPHVVKLTSPESLMLMQDTRLIQLDTAIQMELWQEAYRSAEDVHGMMQLSKDKDKRMVKPASYVNYYDKLALVFWKAGNRLYHAAALLQKFIIYKDMKKQFSTEEALDQATRVLLATLSIPDGADNPSDLTRNLDIEEQHLTNMRLLSNLLRLPIAPTRVGILKEIMRLNLPDLACQSARDLYQILECSFAPLRLANRVTAQLEIIKTLGKPEYDQYVDALMGVTATKIIKQVSLIYDTLSMERVRKMIPFYSEMELECFLVDIAKHRYVKAQIDHREKCIKFGAVDATIAGGMDPEVSDGFLGDAAQIGVDGIREHLELMYNRLRTTVKILDAGEMRENALALVKRQAEIYAYHKDTDYERILMRRKKIEMYKETSERLKMEKSQQAKAEAEKKEEQRRAEEMKRLEQENIEKERMRKQAEQEEIERKIRAEKMKKIQATPIYQAIVKDHGEEAFHNMDPDSVLREQRDRMDEQRREQQARLQQQEKKFDHMVRAYHLEEMIARKELSEQYAKEAPIRHENYERLRIQKAVEDHERAVRTYERMQRVKSDALRFLEDIKKSHEIDFTKKMEEWEAKLQAEKKKRLDALHEKRKEERRRQWLKKRETDLAREKEEQEKARRDEQEAARRAMRQAERERHKRPEEESVADTDTNWRHGAAPLGPRQPPLQRTPMDDRMRERDMDREKGRERAAPPISEADTGKWPRGVNVIGPPREMNRERDRERVREPPRISEADTGKWRVGHVVGPHKEASQLSSDERRGEGVTTRQPPVSDSNRPTTGGTSSSQPWRPRRLQQQQADSSPSINGAPSYSQREKDGGPPHLRELEGRGPPSEGKWIKGQTIGPRRTTEPVNQHVRGSFLRGRELHKTADEDTNWRKK